MGRRGIRDLKTRVGPECSISREGPDCAMEVYRPEKSEEEVTVSRVGMAASGVRAAKSSEFKEGQ